MSWYRYKNETLILNLHIHTKAKINEIAGLHGERLRIRIKSPPVDGKANEMLLAYLAKQFGLSKTKTKIILGSHSNLKSVSLHSPAKLPDWFSMLIHETSDEPEG